MIFTSKYEYNRYVSNSIDGSKEVVERLESLGLTDKEARVYLALLPRKDTGTSKLIRATGLHGQFVYAALARLEELGLAKHVIQNGYRKYSPGSPERILSLIDEKKTTAQQVVKQLQAQFAGAHEQSFEVYQGRGAFVAHEWELLEKLRHGSSVDIIGGGGEEYFTLFAEEFEAFEKMRIDREIRLRYLSTRPVSEHAVTMLSTQTQYFEVRELPQAAPGVETDIYDDQIVFHLYGDPVVSFAFKNPSIAAGYRRFFNVLWNLSGRQSP